MQLLALSQELGKTPCVVNDYPGFIANRILMPMINEAIYSLYEGVAGVEEIDTVMKLGMAHPMGPLQLADFIGLDVCFSILKYYMMVSAIQNMHPVPYWQIWLLQVFLALNQEKDSMPILRVQKIW